MRIFSKIYLSFFCVLLVIFLRTNCSTPTPQEFKPMKAYFIPQYFFEQIDIPEGLAASTDSMAQATVSRVYAHNAIGEYVNLFQVRKEEVNKNYPWQKTWVDTSGIEVTLEINYQKNNKYVWSVYFNGTDQNSEQAYENWLYLQAELGVSGKSQSMTVYDAVSKGIKLIHSWSKMSMYSDDYTLYNYVNGHINEHINFHKDYLYNDVNVRRFLINTDGEYWQESSCTYSLSDGHGNWYRYDENGTIIDKGDWY